MKFTDAYRNALVSACQRNPGEYGTTSENATEHGNKVADKMIAAMSAKGIGAVNCNTATFRSACRVLGIKHNQREMQAALNAETIES